LFSFRKNAFNLPSGYTLDFKSLPSPESINRLLGKCRQETHPVRKFELALKKSAFCLSIFDTSKDKLVGFVRATTDKGLNANLWNLVAEPGDFESVIYEVLLHNSLMIIKREMPGCSVSVAAPLSALKALQAEGFIIDPSGIRAMTLKLR
tara:strand:- start:1098 stop:1547 length:450 start_codon:yes stop_codon:yes gene_type:complete